MLNSRLFKLAEFLQPTDDEPIRSVINQTEQSAVIAWCVKPGQRLAAHVHPHGQDTWIIISGNGLYQYDQSNATQLIVAGDVVIAPKGTIHGVLNNGNEPLIFTSVVSPAQSGFELPSQLGSTIS